MISHLLCFQSVFLIGIMVMQVAIFADSELAENETDHVSLQAFKSKIIDDPQRILNSWNDSLHFCQWEGITCGRRHKRVTILELRSKGLSGTLSPYIGNLSFLRKLDLANNSLQGEIPPEVGRLFRLEDLQLRNNSFVGNIPANLSHCSRLKFLYIGCNQLVGKIPLEFASLCHLKEIVVHGNSLSGDIPDFLGNFTSLEMISVASNCFTGNVPDSLGQLKKLTTLYLAENNLSGTLPPCIYNLSLLVNFSLALNQLQGSFPQNLGLTLPRLKYFQVSHNFFGGSIPISLSNVSEIEHFQMNNNAFSGKLSVDFAGMRHLEFLSVAYNNLGSGEGDEMSFINSLTNCSNLRALVIEENQFRGPLPHSIANLSTKVQYLFLDENQLYGAIPPGLSNLVNLYVLCMNGNKISGAIPKELGKLHNLQYMILSDNKLSGEISSYLGNLSELGELMLNNNKLSGVIPPTLGNLKRLTYLDLSQNDLSGIIPSQIFEITSLSIWLSVARNQLSGSLPPNIGNLKALSTFDVSDNNLSGEIPSQLGLCSSLEYLYMEGNLFRGSIPSSLSSLRGIRDMDLSRNNLSGHIPKFLETLALENLNLSFNDLEGEVPTTGIFTNASAISVAGNSDRLCGGIAKLHLPKCTDNESKKQKISGLSKILISIASVISGLAMILIFILCCLQKRRGKRPLESGPVQLKRPINVSYARLREATNGFSSIHLLGVGSFGSVYKGILEEDGTVVAIKVLDLQRQGATKSFMAECNVLRNIRHRNLVKVITSCSSTDFQGNDFKAVVYEYMQNGSLEKWLHPTLETEEGRLEIETLNLVQRISIAVDVGSAIDYLHHHCQEPILHCDLKPSNVLLDGDMTAHIGDFGLARFFSEVSNPNRSSTIGIRGTIGYAAPEYGLGSAVSTNGDVYSYGILLLEMVTSKRPTDLLFEGGLSLHNFARMALPDNVINIVDPVLLHDDKEMAATNHSLRQPINHSRKECLISMVRIGVACSMASPQDRMNITDAINELHSVKNILLEHKTIKESNGVRSSIKQYRV